MEIKRINEFLLPFNIELICENCKTNDHTTNKVQSDLLTKQRPFVIKKSSKETKPLELTPSKHKLIRKSKMSQRRQQINERKKNTPQPPSLMVMFSSPAQHRNNLKFIQSIGINPPNEFLNLNIYEKSVNRKRDIFRLLEESMKTPIKIGEVEVQKDYRSDVKMHTGYKNQTNSTTEGVVFEFDEMLDDRKNEQPENVSNRQFRDQLALVNEYSRDSSPFHTPVKFMAETPISRFGRTQNSILSISPNDRGNLLMEGAKRNQSDFPMNLFYDAI